MLRTPFDSALGRRTVAGQFSGRSLHFSLANGMKHDYEQDRFSDDGCPQDRPPSEFQFGELEDGTVEEGGLTLESPSPTQGLVVTAEAKPGEMTGM